VVFDEAHTIITSADFRGVMVFVKELMLQGVAVTFITATLPPRLEEHFRTTVRLPENHLRIRANTNRPEHVYIVKVIKKVREDDISDGLRLVARFSAKLANRLQGEERIILFVRRTEDGKTLSPQLYDCPFVSSELAVQQDRIDAVSKWERGETGGILIGTSALIQGLHYDHIRHVVFVGAPWGLMDLVQGAGRGGRDGQLTHVVVFNFDDPLPIDRGSVDPQCRDELTKWLPGGQCRRKIISSTMDGDPVTCESSNSFHCDHCKTKHPHIDTAWTYANSSARPLDKNQRLHQPASMLQQQDDPEPIPMPALRSRMPQADVIQHAAITGLDRDDLRKNTSATFDLVIQHQPACGICWFFRLRAGNTEKPAVRHPRLKDCVRYLDHRVEGFKEFYTWNKPQKKFLSVSCHDTPPSPYHLTIRPSGRTTPKNTMPGVTVVGSHPSCTVRSPERVSTVLGQISLQVLHGRSW
jgi:hypothetical protein